MQLDWHGHGLERGTSFTIGQHARPMQSGGSHHPPMQSTSPDGQMVSSGTGRLTASFAVLLP